MSGFVPMADADDLGVVKPDNDTMSVDGSGTLVARQPVAAQGAAVGIRRLLDLDSEVAYIARTVTDDAIADAVHDLITLSDAIKGVLGAVRSLTTSTVTTVASAVGVGKTFDTVVGSEPSGWLTAGFDDSAWTAPVSTPEGSFEAPPSGSVWVGNNARTNHVANDEFLLRHHFTLPAGAVSAASMDVESDNFCDVYINGTLVLHNPSNDESDIGFFPPASVFITGGANILEIRCWKEAAPPPSTNGIAYVLSVTTLASTPGSVVDAGLPSCGEGGIYYSHSGAPACLAVGPAFSVVQSNGADPLYGDVPLQVLLSGVLEAVRGKVNFIPGANIGLTVADDPTHSKVDVTIAGAAAAGAGTAQSGHVSITIAAGTASNTAAITFSPAFAAAPNVLVSSSSGDLIASAESVTGSGFTARLTANVALAPGTSITATLYWSVGTATATGRHKVLWLQMFR